MFIKALASFADVDIVSFLGDKVDSSVDNCKIVYSKMFPDTRPQKHGRLYKLMCLFNTRNPETLYPRSEEKTRIVSEFVNQNHYDYIACRYLNEAVDCGLLQYADKLIVDIDDNPTNVYRLFLKDMSLMSFRNRIYQLLYLNTVDKLVQNMVKRIFVTFYSSPVEKASSKSVFLHNVSSQECNNKIITNMTPCRILLVGFFDHFPNVDGVRHFVKNVFPRVLAQQPQVEFHIVGRIKDEELRMFLSAQKNVVLKGFVENLAKEYEECRVAVVPIYSGSGTSVKSAEAMKMLRPFVSAEVGVRGYSNSLVNGKDYILAKSDEEFANAIVNLLSNVDIANSMAKNAFDKYQQNWSTERFVEIVRNAVIKE